MVSERVLRSIKEISGEILEAQRPIRVLRAISWGEDVERTFFASHGISLMLRRTRSETTLP